ncbi:head-tail connector protein [Paludisphaera borealis]|uniref:Phage gp6-like head-tail connector protein n=1 Tax=Paludisphaera borealis TaxID=1387353 RepID=A0A1U7CX62_9BACT|nr:head-tail connector protein [Paludisphaera borealis]APW63534.1 hypothetical protein BSF38_05106 [Paludisphaera borealis]
MRPSYELTITTGPTAHPLTLEEARAQLNSPQGLPDDVYVESLIATAHRYIAKGFNLTPMTTQYRLVTGRFVKDLPHPPVQSIQSIQYYDSTETLITLEAGDYSFYPGSSKIHYRSDLCLYASARTDRVIINYTAGYASAELVPDSIKHAMRLLIGHWYEQRQATGESTVKAIELGVRDLLFTEKCHRWRA